MTSKEAINLIDIIRMGYICDPQECGAENARELCDIFKCDDFHEACVMAIEALEKQESIEYVMKLNLQYIDKIAHTKDISRKKSIRYIKEHLIASTRALVKWSDEE